jgi:hypothetical protein
MIAALVMAAVLVLVDVAVGVRMWHQARPAGRPESHRSWRADRLPSRPYTMSR